MVHKGGNRIQRLVGRGGAATALMAVVVVGASMGLNDVETTVTDADRRVIAELGVDRQCATTDGFDEEIECIEAVQTAMFERYPDTSDSFEKGVTDHHVEDYDRRGYGSCYDRARLLEQTLRHYGFRARRIALYQKQSSLLGYLQPGIDSHALTEVETTKGWMAVDTIDPVVAVDDRERIYTVEEIRAGLRKNTVDDETFGTEIPDNFFDGEFVSFSGVYSRHGYFFEPHIPVPEVNWTHLGW